MCLSEDIKNKNLQITEFSKTMVINTGDLYNLRSVNKSFLLKWSLKCLN